VLIRVARSVANLESRNVLTLRRVKVRFQFGAGADDALGIEGVNWSVSLNGAVVTSGITDAKGEVSFLMSPNETVVLNIFDTDYNVTMHPGLEAATERDGQQKRLDMLGYMIGYLRNPIGSNRTDDDQDGPLTRQAILNFQTDSNLHMDSVPGRRTRGELTNIVGA
jgi:hypothetical protein